MALVLATFVVPSVVNAASMFGGALDCLSNPGDCVAVIIGYFIQAILYLLSILLGMVGNILDKVLRFKSFVTPGVVTGWEVVRDLVNMGFILVLLAVAFGTILNLKDYNVKEILPKLVVVALLINFSLPLVTMVVDASQIVMISIYNAMAGGLSGDCAASTPGNCLSNLAGIKDLLVQSSDTEQLKLGSHEPWTVVGNLILATIFLFVFIGVLSVGTLLLVVRIVGIWMIMIFSPLAFFSYILPGMKSISSSWQKKLWQYTFFGPIYMFFLWISLILLTSVPSMMSAEGWDKATIFEGKPVSDFFKYLANVLQFILVIVMLMWSFVITRKLGIQYGDAWAKKAEGIMKDTGWKVAGYGTRGVKSGAKTLSGYNFAKNKTGNWAKRNWGAWKQLRDERKDQRESEKKVKATRRADRLNQFIGRRESWIPGLSKRGQMRLTQGDVRKEQEVGDEMKKIGHINTDKEILYNYKKAVSPAKKEALIRKAAQLGSLGTILNSEGYYNDRDGLQQFLKKNFKDTPYSAKLANTLASISSSQAHQTQFAGAAKFDPDTGKYVFTDPVKDKNDQENGVFFSTGGDYPQSLARNLRAQLFGVTSDPGDPTKWKVNQDGVKFLQRIRGKITWSEHAKEILPTVVADFKQHLAEYEAAAGKTGGEGLGDLLVELKKRDAREKVDKLDVKTTIKVDPTTGAKDVNSDIIPLLDSLTGFDDKAASVNWTHVAGSVEKKVVDEIKALKPQFETLATTTGSTSLRSFLDELKAQGRI